MSDGLKTPKCSNRVPSHIYTDTTQKETMMFKQNMGLLKVYQGPVMLTGIFQGGSLAEAEITILYLLTYHS